MAVYTNLSLQGLVKQITIVHDKEATVTLLIHDDLEMYCKSETSITALLELV